MADAVSSKTLQGLAARFGLRAGRSGQQVLRATSKTKKRTPASQRPEPAAPKTKKPRLDSGQTQDGEEEDGKCGDIGLVTEGDAEHLARHRGDKKCDTCSRCKLLGMAGLYSLQFGLFPFLCLSNCFFSGAAFLLCLSVSPFLPIKLWSLVFLSWHRSACPFALFEDTRYL